MPIADSASDEYMPSTSNDGHMLSFVSKAEDPLGDIKFGYIKKFSSTKSQSNQFTKIHNPGFSDSAPIFSFDNKEIFFLSKKIGSQINTVSTYTIKTKRLRRFNKTDCDELFLINDSFISCIKAGLLINLNRNYTQHGKKLWRFEFSHIISLF